MSASIIRVSFSAWLNLLLICSIWRLIKLVDALASHLSSKYRLETSNDASKSESVSSKGSFFSWHTFCLHANFDPDLIYIYWCGMCQLENSKPKFCFGFFAYNQGKLNGIFFYLMAPLLLKSECCNPCSSSLSPLSPASKFAKLLMHILSFFFSFEFLVGRFLLLWWAFI